MQIVVNPEAMDHWSNDFKQYAHNLERIQRGLQHALHHLEWELRQTSRISERFYEAQRQMARFQDYLQEASKHLALTANRFREADQQESPEMATAGTLWDALLQLAVAPALALPAVANMLGAVSESVQEMVCNPAQVMQLIADGAVEQAQNLWGQIDSWVDSHAEEIRYVGDFFSSASMVLGWTGVAVAAISLAFPPVAVVAGGVALASTLAGGITLLTDMALIPTGNMGEGWGQKLLFDTISVIPTMWLTDEMFKTGIGKQVVGSITDEMPALKDPLFKWVDGHFSSILNTTAFVVSGAMHWGEVKNK